MALLEYRRGNHVKAAEWARGCLAYPEFNAPRSATAHIILAMASWGSGQRELARTELQLGREMVEGKFRNGLDRGSGVQGFWFDWVFARILLREAGIVIGANPLSQTK